MTKKINAVEASIDEVKNLLSKVLEAQGAQWEKFHVRGGDKWKGFDIGSYLSEEGEIFRFQS